MPLDPTHPEYRFRLALSHLFRARHATRDPVSLVWLHDCLRDFPGYAWCPESVPPFVLPAAEAAGELVVLRSEKDPDPIDRYAGEGPELRLRRVLDRLFRALHHAEDRATRRMLATGLADFPGYAWCPEDGTSFARPLAELGDDAVWLRSPDGPEEALALAAAAVLERWNPPRPVGDPDAAPRPAR